MNPRASPAVDVVHRALELVIREERATRAKEGYNIRLRRHGLDVIIQFEIRAGDPGKVGNRRALIRPQVNNR